MFESEIWDKNTINGESINQNRSGLRSEHSSFLFHTISFTKSRRTRVNIKYNWTRMNLEQIDPGQFYLKEEIE